VNGIQNGKKCQSFYINEKTWWKKQNEQIWWKKYVMSSKMVEERIIWTLVFCSLLMNVEQNWLKEVLRNVFMNIKILNVK